MLLVLLPLQCEHAVAEHLVADASQQWIVLAEFFGQRQMVLGKLVSHVVEVGLIEYAAPVIGCQCSEVLAAEGFALCLQASQIGLVRQFVGTYLGCLEPHLACFHIAGIAHHPVQHALQSLHILAYGEDAGSLQVGLRLYILQVYSPL